MDRDCNNCVYSTRDGGCKNWNCNQTSVKELEYNARVKALDDMVAGFENVDSYEFASFTLGFIRELADSLKDEMGTDTSKERHIKEFANWLVKYKVVDERVMDELIRDFKGEMGC